jgi:5-methylcytosine-specific restriction protein B
MSRYNPHHQTAALYSAAQQWLEQSLIGEMSVFTGAPSLWTSLYLDEIDLRFVRNLDEGSGSFIEKLNEQLAGGTPECRQLMAELMWVLGLSPSNIGPETKRKSVTEIWSWSGASLSLDHELLPDEVLQGIGSAGTAYNTQRWREVAFAITIFRNLRALDEPRQLEILSDPWRFAEWLGGQEGAANRQLLHILPHLVFPDTFERISSAGDKKKILAAFTDEPLAVWRRRDGIDLDRALLALRERLEAEAGEPIDFYWGGLRGLPKRLLQRGAWIIFEASPMNIDGPRGSNPLTI